MKKILKVIIFFLLCIWQLPQLLIAIFILPFCGKLKIVAKRHYNICLSGTNLYKNKNISAGISLGPICIVTETLTKYPADIAHELDGHTVDSKRFGPLYLFIVGIPSILNAMCRFTECYYDFYPERWANEHAGLIVNKKGRLEFKKEEVQA